MRKICKVFDIWISFHLSKTWTKILTKTFLNNKLRFFFVQILLDNLFQAKERSRAWVMGAWLARALSQSKQRRRSTEYLVRRWRPTKEPAMFQILWHWEGALESIFFSGPQLNQTFQDSSCPHCMSLFHSVCRLQVQQTSAAESLQKQKWCAKSDARFKNQQNML